MPVIVIGELHAPTDPAIWAEEATMSVLVLDPSEPDGVLLRLEGVWLDMEAGARKSPDPDFRVPTQVLWLGGSYDEVRPPERWKEQIQALGAVRGFDIEVIEQPARRFAEARNRVATAGADVLLVWTPYAGAQWANVVGANPRAAVHEIGERELESALLEARLTLDSVPHRASRVEDSSRPAPGAGEVRYYKKHFARVRGGDKLLDWHDCRHNCWVIARDAPQAEIGVAKLESGAQWSKLEKCDRCAGGGVWRATF
jgi:hypothetical protein